MNRILVATDHLNAAPIFIDDTPALTPLAMRSRTRRAVIEHGVGMVIVDYIQLMTSPGKFGTRELEVADISRNLKAMAKELNIPVLALSQLNRKLEERADKRPMLSDLRESGAIEQDADVIMFLYREEMYKSKAERQPIHPAEIIVAKQRNGATGTVPLQYNSTLVRFENPALPGF